MSALPLPSSVRVRPLYPPQRACLWGRQGHLPPLSSSSALISPRVLSPSSHQLSPSGSKRGAAGLEEHRRCLRLDLFFFLFFYFPFSFPSSFLEREGDTRREKPLPNTKCTQFNCCPSGAKYSRFSKPNGNFTSSLKDVAVTGNG